MLRLTRPAHRPPPARLASLLPPQTCFKIFQAHSVPALFLPVLRDPIQLQSYGGDSNWKCPLIPMWNCRLAPRTPAWPCALIPPPCERPWGHLARNSVRQGEGGPGHPSFPLRRPQCWLASPHPSKLVLRVTRKNE